MIAISRKTQKKKEKEANSRSVKGNNFIGPSTKFLINSSLIKNTCILSSKYWVN